MMFSPNVIYEDPWRERILITLFVRGDEGGSDSAGDRVDATIHCSFRTNWNKC